MGVKLDKICKTIKGTHVLTNVNAYFPDGVITGLKGINGLGKTMIMRIISGLIRPTSGNVLIDDLQLWKDISFPDDIGLLIENPAFLPYLTGFDNLKMLADIRGKIGAPDISRALLQVGLEPKDKRKYGQYSLGMKQRLGIAAAFMEHPHILLLDEPTNALDTQGVDLLKDILISEKKRGNTVILSCHDYQVLRELSDNIYIVENGSILRYEKVKDE